MQEQLLQSPWQQAKLMKPRLSSEVEVFRRHYRDEQWYVLRRSGSERLYRVNPEAWRIIGLCDGERSLETIFAHIKSDEGSFTENDLLGVISQLLQQGLVTLGNQSGAESLVAGKRRERWVDRLKNPLAIRFPLWSPDLFLSRHLDKVSQLFTRFVFVAWALIVLVALLVALAHWNQISNDVIDRVFSPGNLLILWLIYPITKLIHELGHAFAIKVQGGEVHEIGVMFMYGVPMPYVDASDALTFADKRQRLLVDGIGIMVELFVAAIALFVWLQVSAGLVSQLAYNTMLICSVSTLIFNGNPLMRFDGYYLLADFLEIPNLATRAIQYWRHLFNRRILGVDSHFEADTRERRWLLVYAPLALAYRLTVLAAIVLVAAQVWLPLGVVLGAWVLFRFFISPVARGFQYLLSPQLGEQRAQGIKVALLIPALVVVLIAVIPFPVLRTMPAVVWLPDQAKIRTATEGQVLSVLPEEGEVVRQGQLLFQLDNPYLSMERDVVDARYREISVRLQAARAHDLVQAQQYQEDLKSTGAELEQLEQQLQQLQVKSPVEGHFFLPAEAEGKGRFVHQGDVLAYVLSRDRVILRVLVDQNDIGLVRGRRESLTVKLANWPSRTFEGKVLRIIPSASARLPSAVLSNRYGGPIQVDPTDRSGVNALTEWFQLEVEVLGLPEPGNNDNPQLLWAGSRAWVSFDLGYEPIATQLYWVLSQLFMKKLQI